MGMWNRNSLLHLMMMMIMCACVETGITTYMLLSVELFLSFIFLFRMRIQFLHTDALLSLRHIKTSFKLEKIMVVYSVLINQITSAMKFQEKIVSRQTNFHSPLSHLQKKKTQKIPFPFVLIFKCLLSQ